MTMLNVAFFNENMAVVFIYLNCTNMKIYFVYAVSWDTKALQFTPQVQLY